MTHGRIRIHARAHPTTAFVKKEEIDELLDASWSKADNSTISRMQTLFTCCGYKSVTQ
jgi:hypothetical protein